MNNIFATLLTQPPTLGSHETFERTFEWIFIALQLIGGQICLPLLLFTYLFLGTKNLPSGRALRRDPTVISFVITWIISSCCYSILLYWERSDPILGAIPVTSSALCLVQASLTPAAQAMTTTSTLILAINIWNAISRSGFEKEKRRWDKLINLSFICLPYVVFIAFFVETFLLGNRPIPVNTQSDPKKPPMFVQVDNLAVPTMFYCVVVTDPSFTTPM